MQKFDKMNVDEREKLLNRFVYNDRLRLHEEPKKQQEF